MGIWGRSVDWDWNIWLREHNRGRKRFHCWEYDFWEHLSCSNLSSNLRFVSANHGFDCVDVELEVVSAYNFHYSIIDTLHNLPCVLIFSWPIIIYTVHKFLLFSLPKRNGFSLGYIALTLIIFSNYSCKANIAAIDMRVTVTITKLDTKIGIFLRIKTCCFTKQFSNMYVLDLGSQNLLTYGY